MSQQFCGVAFGIVQGSVMQPTIILIGASVRSLAESAINCGWTPLCLDMFGDADLRQILRESMCPEPITIAGFTDLPEIFQQLPVDLPVIWCGGLENHTDVVKQLGGRCLVGATTAAIRRVRQPMGLQAIVDGTNCRTPDVLPLSQDPLATGSWLIKSNSSAGGVGVRWPGEDMVGGDYLQQFVPGTPLSALFCAGPRSIRLLGTTVQVIGDSSLGGGAFMYCGNVGPVMPSPALQSTILNVGKRLASLGLVGVFGADFVVGVDGLWLIEVNPRIPASHELYDTCHPKRLVLQDHLEACEVSTPAGVSDRDLLEESPGDRDCSGRLARLIVYTMRDVKVTDSDVATLLEFRRYPQHASWLADIPVPGSLSVGQPLCSVYHQLDGNAIDSGVSSEIDAIVGRISGISSLNTYETARRHSSLFESNDTSDNGCLSRVNDRF